MAQQNNGTWMAFLAMTFVVVGLTGLFATFAAPLPLERAMLRDTALDDALATQGQPNQAALLASLRPRLESSAAAVVDGKGDLPDRVAVARTAMHAEMQHEADAIASRLQLLVVVVTAVGAVFGAVIVGAVSRPKA